jgi:hypothetical protein
MRDYPRFPGVIPHSRVDYLCITHPSATLLTPCGAFAFDLHVLGTPPAFTLSQDQTLQLVFKGPKPLKPLLSLMLKKKGRLCYVG